MQKIIKRTSLVTLFLVGLAGCNTNEEDALQNGQKDEALPIGYYSNENHENRGGNAIVLDGSDNDGPLVEILDHTLGKERELNQRVRRSNRTENTPDSVRPVNEERQTRTGEPLLGRRDMNYHGHLKQENHTERKSYDNVYDGQLAEKLTKAVQDVPNIKDAHALVYGKNVVIGVIMGEKNRTEETRRNVHEAVQQHVRGKKVYYVTNESRFQAIKTLSQQLKKGGNREEIEREIEHLLRSLDQRQR